MAKRRSRAREAGLCTRCCKEKPNPGRTICVQCNVATLDRVRRKRIRDRRKIDARQVLAAHEHAGDVARDHHLYADASQHYRDALHVEVIAPIDRTRVSEKLAYALSLGANPNAANPLFDTALVRYLDHPASVGKAVEILLQSGRQLWIDARAEEALPIIRQAVRIANADGDRRLRILANSRMANYLLGLARYEEAEQFILAIGEIDESDDASICATYYTQRAIFAAAFGHAKEAFEYFERAVSAAKEDTDVFHAAHVWSVYAAWASELGVIQRAKSCLEQALLVARRYHIVWLITDLCLYYAEVLNCIGQYSLAYEYVLNALAYGAHAARTDTLLARVGIPIALRMEDETTLTKCARTSTIEAIFRSGVWSEISYVTASFAQWYVAHGNRNEAEKVLHRALEAFERTQGIILIEAFSIAVARFGAKVDIPKAREIIESRVALPNADVAYACLELFDAFVAQRHKLPVEVQQHAAEALRRFELLGWHGYADMARTLLPPTIRVPSSGRAENKLFTDVVPVLSLREQQVVELVLKGLTNRAISAELSISENTVEKHMTSIMNRLGIRSRHQLGAVVESDEVETGAPKRLRIP